MTGFRLKIGCVAIMQTHAPHDLCQISYWRGFPSASWCWCFTQICFPRHTWLLVFSRPHAAAPESFQEEFPSMSHPSEIILMMLFSWRPFEQMMTQNESNLMNHCLQFFH